MGVIRPEVTGMFGGKTLRSAGLSAVLTLTTLAMPLASQAAWVTVTGSSFDISYDDQAVGAYGTPLILGDTIVFTPTAMSLDFASLHSSGAATWTTSVLVTPHEGVDLSTMQLTERGDYSVDTFDGEPLDNEVEFSVDARLFVSSISDPSNEFAFLEADYDFGDAGPTNLALWNFSREFSVAGFSSGFLLTLQNTLDYDLGLGFATPFLQKKYVGLQLGAGAEVPLPGAMFLMGSALAMLLVARKRRVY